MDGDDYGNFRLERVKLKLFVWFIDLFIYLLIADTAATGGIIADKISPDGDVIEQAVAAKGGIAIEQASPGDLLIIPLEVGAISGIEASQQSSDDPNMIPQGIAAISGITVDHINPGDDQMMPSDMAAISGITADQINPGDDQRMPPDMAAISGITAYQSSTNNLQMASLAIDGNLDNDKSACASTKGAKMKGWWRTDLGGTHTVTGVDITTAAGKSP